MSFIIVAQFIVVLILAAIAAIVIVFAIALAQATSNYGRKEKFEWSYHKLLYSYKIKVLVDELRKRNVKMEDLYEIIHDALEQKQNKKHVLYQVEEEVKGEMEQIKKEK